MIQVDVLRRNDYFLEIMLDIGNLIKKLSFVVVVNKRDCSGNFLALKPLFLYQLLPD